MRDLAAPRRRRLLRLVTRRRLEEMPQMGSLPPIRTGSFAAEDPIVPNRPDARCSSDCFGPHCLRRTATVLPNCRPCVPHPSMARRRQPRLLPYISLVSCSRDAPGKTPSADSLGATIRKCLIVPSSDWDPPPEAECRYVAAAFPFPIRRVAGAWELAASAFPIRRVSGPLGIRRFCLPYPSSFGSPGKSQLLPSPSRRVPCPRTVATSALLSRRRGSPPRFRGNVSARRGYAAPTEQHCLTGKVIPIRIRGLGWPGSAPRHGSIVEPRRIPDAWPQHCAGTDDWGIMPK